MRASTPSELYKLTERGGDMEVQHIRKNPMPAVRADHDNGLFLLEHGEPHDPCPVEGCMGTLLFLHR